jgi:ethanolamine ammonia-lyase small subunit
MSADDPIAAGANGQDPWSNLRRFTDARIGLGRSGSAMPTREVLAFTLAHSEARDAVLTPIDWTSIEAKLNAAGLDTVRVASAVQSRAEYLRRPDLGRRLSGEARENLLRRSAAPDFSKPDLLIVAGDGLSSRAVAANLCAFIAALRPHLVKDGVKLGPVILANEARVALGDDAGEALGAKCVLMLIGERPGLSSPDSLGAYLSFAPKVGLKDADRNCISNIRVRGLSYEEAAFKTAWLLREAFRLGLTGVSLKDDSNFQLEGKTAPSQIA